MKKKDYKGNFITSTPSLYSTGKGLSLDVINQITTIKNEVDWMSNIRIKAYNAFLKLKLPKFGPSLKEIDFNDYVYYLKTTAQVVNDWANVPIQIKETFDKLGIPKSEQKYFGGVTTQFESEAIYHKTLVEFENKGVIFCDMDSALKKYPYIVKKYFGSIVSCLDNKFAALNTAVWSGGSFIYVPKDVKLEKPLQSYFRINSERMGQFERTLIVVDDNASVHYIEGCTAPKYTSFNLHAAVVEIFVGRGAYCRYSTVQNWSDNVLNLVTKRALVLDDGQMDWIDGNIGSGINMKYPACILKGDNSIGNTISIAFARKNQIQDTGARMIHLGKNTISKILSKSICVKGGVVNYRGKVFIGEKANNSYSKIECGTMILDNESFSDTLPTNIVNNNTSRIEHEAFVSNISEEQLFYMMSRGINEEQALEMLVMGFIEPFKKELPMEYAVELNRLISLEMKGFKG